MLFYNEDESVLVETMNKEDFVYRQNLNNGVIIKKSVVENLSRKRIAAGGIIVPYYF